MARKLMARLTDYRCKEQSVRKSVESDNEKKKRDSSER